VILSSLVEETHFKKEKWFKPGANAITSNGRGEKKRRNQRERKEKINSKKKQRGRTEV